MIGIGMDSRARGYTPAMSVSGLVSSVRGLWWSLLGVPMVTTLHVSVVLLGAFPVTLAVGPYGLAVIALTLLVRLVLVPLAFWQASEAAKARDEAATVWREVEPELARLRRRWRRDPRRLQEETVALMRARGADPVVTGLRNLVPVVAPLVLQLPLLWALYAAIGAAAAGPMWFLWVPSLAHPDPLLLPLLTAAATWLASWIAGRRQPAPVAGSGAISVVMPLAIGVMAHFAPAALALYWLTGTVSGIGQQTVVGRVFRPRVTASAPG